MTDTDEAVDTVIIGAGPYGLSVASYLSFLEIPHRLIGVPMEFWHTHMSDDLQMRSTLEHTCPSNPDGLALLTDWVTEHVHDIGPRPLATLFPHEFREFMKFFVEHFGISILQRYVRSIDETDHEFLVRLDDGSGIATKNIVIAVGLGGMERTPTWFNGAANGIPIRHSAQAAELEYSGRSVLVIGGGQSAAETALKAVQAGARSVEMAFREPALVFNSMHSEFTSERRRRLFKVKHAYQTSAADFRSANIAGILPTSIEPSLQEDLQGRVRLQGGMEVVRAIPSDEGVVKVEFSCGKSKVYDRIICATGYRPTLARLPIELRLRNEIRTLGQLPDITENAESSVDGLFFIGAWAAARYGPQSNFVYGSQQMVPRLIGRVARYC